MQKRDFETYQKRFRDFEILPKFSETHVFRVWRICNWITELTDTGSSLASSKGVYQQQRRLLAAETFTSSKGVYQQQRRLPAVKAFKTLLSSHILLVHIYHLLRTDHEMQPEIHPIASSRFLLSTTEGVITTRSNRMKFRLQQMVIRVISKCQQHVPCVADARNLLYRVIQRVQTSAWAGCNAGQQHAVNRLNFKYSHLDCRDVFLSSYSFPLDHAVSC